MSRSDNERFGDILAAIQRCENYEPYLRSEEFASTPFSDPDLILDIVDQQLTPLADRLRNL